MSKNDDTAQRHASCTTMDVVVGLCAVIASREGDPLLFGKTSFLLRGSASRIRLFSNRSMTGPESGLDLGVR